MDNTLPKALIDQVQEGNCVLFLGSGANYGAINSKNERIPLGPDLGRLIAKKFLSDDSFIDSPLAMVSELAISETSLFAVQKYVAEVFQGFPPQDYHRMMPSFIWKAIFTTNYDTIIEQTYRENKDPLQNLSPVFKNTDQSQVFSSNKSLPYYKLHGCINNVEDAHTPLILTPEQYISHRKNRENLFERLRELAYSNPFVFIGYSMADLNIRTILAELNESLDVRPRSYIISPNIKNEEIRLWNSKKISPIPISFESFINKLNTSISPNNRILARFRPQTDYPIYSKFVIDPNTILPTEAFIQFLNQDVDYLHPNFQSGNSPASAFYKGYFENWDAIISDYDVVRGLTNSIISEVLFEDQYNDSEGTYLFLIQGQAGSGKSVLLKRVAWNAAISYDRICLYLKPGATLNVGTVAELFNYVRERIYIFIDGVAGREKIYKSFIDGCKEEKLPVTIIATERTNIWNTDCIDTHKYLTLSYTLRYLNDGEINILLELLEKYNCLGLLSQLSPPDRVKALSEQAGRELLVALYEATWGIPFEDIIYDEYTRINNEAAKSMYLTVCILHRLGASARAGLIARVHGINFSEFRRSLFEPLEFIVFAKEDYKINDYVYLTRHKQIADIVFQRVLSTVQDKYDAYVQVLTYLNTDFESDRVACLAMTNARKLKPIFGDSVLVSNLFDIADKNNPSNPKIKQQRAIYEMQVPSGNLNKAQTYLDQALELTPNDPQILHSVAELLFKRAEKSTYIIEQNQYLQESLNMCSKIIKRHKESVYPYHTMLKVYLFKLEAELKKDKVTSIDNIIKDFEKILNQAKQFHSDDEMIIGEEASLNELLNNTPTAKLLLKSAYEANKGSSYISLRYASLLRNERDIKGALKVLSDTLNLNPNDREVNLKYGTYAAEDDSPNYEIIKHYLRKSFTVGDNRYIAQMLYARALYLNNEINLAQPLFKQLESVTVDYGIKNTVRSIVTANRRPIRFTGSIKRVESSYGFIIKDTFGDSVYFKPSDTTYNLKPMDKVSFEIGFTFKGPIAINLKPE